MANTKASLDDLVDTFNTYIGTADYANAEATLVQLTARLLTLPDTANMRWSRTVADLRALLASLKSESASYRPTSAYCSRRPTS